MTTEEILEATAQLTKNISGESKLALISALTLWLQEERRFQTDSSSKPFVKTNLREVAGCLCYQGKPKTLEDMEAAIAQGIEERG